MSHARATATTLTPNPARTNEATAAHPLLVVETFDRSAGSTVLFTYGRAAASAGAAQFTFCVQEASPDAQFTFCVQEAPVDNAQFTFCVQESPVDASGAGTVAVDGDAVVGSWL